MGETYDDSGCGSADISRFLPRGDRPRRRLRRLDVGHLGNCESLISNYSGTPANAYSACVRTYHTGASPPATATG